LVTYVNVFFLSVAIFGYVRKRFFHAIAIFGYVRKRFFRAVAIFGYVNFKFYFQEVGTKINLLTVHDSEVFKIATVNFGLFRA